MENSQGSWFKSWKKQDKLCLQNWQNLEDNITQAENEVITFIIFNEIFWLSFGLVLLDTISDTSFQHVIVRKVTITGANVMLVQVEILVRTTKEVDMVQVLPEEEVVVLVVIVEMIIMAVPVVGIILKAILEDIILLVSKMDGPQIIIRMGVVEVNATSFTFK